MVQIGGLTTHSQIRKSGYTSYLTSLSLRILCSKPTHFTPHLPVTVHLHAEQRK